MNRPPKTIVVIAAAIASAFVAFYPVTVPAPLRWSQWCDDGMHGVARTTILRWVISGPGTATGCAP